MNSTFDLNPFEPKFSFNYFSYIAENHPHFKVFMGIVSILTGISGLFGNTLSIVVLLRRSMRVYAYNLLLMTLAVWDNIFIVTFLYSFDCVGDVVQLIKTGSVLPPSYIGVYLYPYLYPTWLLGKFVYTRNKIIQV